MCVYTYIHMYTYIYIQIQHLVFVNNDQLLSLKVNHRLEKMLNYLERNRKYCVYA